MRADFWGECAAYPALREAIQAHEVLIAPMDGPDLRRAIDQQAGVVGLRFEAELSFTIVEDVQNEPGAMPLLQHALMELWKRRHGRWLRVAEYHAIGKVQQAIAHTADQLYAQSAPEEQARMRDVFVRLTRLGEEGAEARPSSDARRDTRRRVPLDELIPAGADPALTRALVQRLADTRLVVTDRNAALGRDEVELAHEALIRYWPRLRRWLNDDRPPSACGTGSLGRPRLAGRPGRCPRREPAGAPRDAPGHGLGAAGGGQPAPQRAGAGLRRGLRRPPPAPMRPRRRPAASASSRRRWPSPPPRPAGPDESRRSERRLRSLAGVLAVLAVVSALSRPSAPPAASLAALRRRRAGSDPAACAPAPALLLRAKPSSPPAPRAARLLGGHLSARSQGYAPAARLSSASAPSPPATRVRYRRCSAPPATYDRTGRAALGRPHAEGRGAPQGARERRAGPRLQPGRGPPRGLRRAATPRPSCGTCRGASGSTCWRSTPGPSPPSPSAPPRSAIATASLDGTARIWDAETGRRLHLLSGPGAPLTALAFNFNGRLLAATGQDPTVLVWDTLSGERHGQWAGHTQAVTGVAFSPTQDVLATASLDGTARLWDAGSGLPGAVLEPRAAALTGVRLQPQRGPGGDLRRGPHGPPLAGQFGHRDGRLSGPRPARDGRHLQPQRALPGHAQP